MTRLDPLLPIGSRHAGCVKRLNEILAGQLAGQAMLGVQDPIHLNDFTELHPDVSDHPEAQERFREAAEVEF